jgi:hypothetical protein
MGWSDVIPVIENLAPTIASAIGTPLLGGAVAALEGVFGLTPPTSSTLSERQDSIASAVTIATPEELAAVRKADQDYAARMAEAGFKDKEAIAALQLQEQALYVGDTADARRANANNDRVFWLGVVILTTFAAIMFASLWGAYALLTGDLPVSNSAVVGMVSVFVGTVIGYVSANAQQVVGFFFGSSKGSEAKSDQMAAAFSQALSQPVVATPVGSVVVASGQKP